MKTSNKIIRLAATLITFGSLAGGANAAVTYFIDNSGTKLVVWTSGGDLDLSSDAVTDNASSWSSNVVYTDSFRTGVTTANQSARISGDISMSSGWTNGTIADASGSWSGASSFCMLFTDRTTVDNLYLAPGTVSGVVGFGAGVFTTDADHSVAGSGLTAGESVTWTSGTSGDTVTFSVVPEPSSTALLGLGGLALMLRRRR